MSENVDGGTKGRESPRILAQGGQTALGNSAKQMALSVLLAGLLYLAAIVLRTKILSFVAMRLSPGDGQLHLGLAGFVEINRGWNHRKATELHFGRKSLDFSTM